MAKNSRFGMVRLLVMLSYTMLIDIIVYKFKLVLLKINKGEMKKKNQKFACCKSLNTINDSCEFLFAYANLKKFKENLSFANYNTSSSKCCELQKFEWMKLRRYDI